MFDKYIIRWNIRNIRLRFKYYHLFRRKKGEANVTLFILEESKIYPGIADIIKAIVGSYYISKINGTKFKIVFKVPFLLSEYLEPNQIDWRISDDEIDYSILNTSLINYRGVGNNIKYSKCRNQYHIYNFLGINILQRNNVKDWKQKWHELFKELFRPTQLISKSLEVLPYVADEFVAVHVRFINALEVLEPSCLSWSKLLDKDEKVNLLNRVFIVIDKIQNITKNVLVFSDSNVFLRIAQERGLKCLPGKVGHIGYKENQDTVLKTFVDWFAMSKASKIFRIKGDCLYNSAFPLYASLIGNKPYVELDINDYEGINEDY